MMNGGSSAASARRAFLAALAIWLLACQPAIGPSPAGTRGGASAAPTQTPVPTRLQHVGFHEVVLGDPIDRTELHGRIVFDDFEDVYAIDVDGSHLVRVAAHPGAEFDGAWSPDGAWIVYRDSTRGVNENDEVFIARADGSERRNLTNDPSNDWGPDWSPDGTTIAFNSDRAGGVMGGYLVDPDATNLRRIDVDTWVEYPSFSPDGRRIAFMGAVGSNYEIYVVDLATNMVDKLTDSPGHDAWPAWSPDGKTIAFSSVRDDCRFAPATATECWRSGDIGEYYDIWLVDPDGSNPRRASTEFGQFVAWSPDSRYLLVSGAGLYVIRPDGTGRTTVSAEGVSHALGGGIPDWR